MAREIDPAFRARCPNEYRIEGDTAILTLTQGQETVVDLADLPVVLRYRWYAGYNTHVRGWYARANLRTVDGGQATLDLHRYLLRPPVGLVVDHINHLTLDNRRANLRAVSNAVNTANRRAAPRRAATGELNIRRWACHSAGRTYVYHRFECAIGKEASGSPCAVKCFPNTPAGLAAAIVYRDAHWATRHPHIRTHPLPPLPSEEAA